MDVWEWGNIKENKYKKRKDSNCDSKQADKNIKHCKSCDRCWEMDRTKAHQSHKTRGTFSAYLYYEDFPKRGKEIKTCPSCGGD